MSKRKKNLQEYFDKNLAKELPGQDVQGLKEPSANVQVFENTVSFVALVPSGSSPLQLWLSVMTSV